MDAGAREAIALYLSARAGFFSVRRAPQPPFQTRAVGRAAQQRGLGVNALRGEYSSAGFIYGSSSCSVQAAAAGWRRLRIGGGCSPRSHPAPPGRIAIAAAAGLFIAADFAECSASMAAAISFCSGVAAAASVQASSHRCFQRARRCCAARRWRGLRSFARKAAWAFQAATEPALLCVNDLKPKKNRGEPAKTPPGPAQASSRL